MYKYKIIIAGSREFNNYTLLSNILNGFINYLNKNDIEIISGNARGADKLGELYAKTNNIKLKIFPANWSKIGKSAGFVRNTEMAKYGTHLIAFWDGKSSGTKHMIKIAKENNLKIIIYNYNKNMFISEGE